MPEVKIVNLPAVTSAVGTDCLVVDQSVGTRKITLNNLVNSPVTTQGNTFNGVSQLLQLNSSGQLPALDASLLTNLDISNVGSGLLALAYGGTGLNNTSYTAAVISSTPQNDYNPGSQNQVIRLSSSESVFIHGLTFTSGQTDGETHYLINVGSNPIGFTNNGSGSANANRFLIDNGITGCTITTNQSVKVVYDGTQSRWILNQCASSINRIDLVNNNTFSVLLSIPTGGSGQNMIRFENGSFGNNAVLADVDSIGDLIWYTIGGTNNSAPAVMYGSSATPWFSLTNTGVFGWSSSPTNAAYPAYYTNDTALARGAPAVVSFTNGSTGGGTFAAPSNSPSSLSSSQNNYNPGSPSYFQRWSSSANISITGLTFTTTQVDGQTHFIENAGSFTISFTSQSASSTAANRFVFYGYSTATGTLTIGPNQCVQATYDATVSRWILVPSPNSLSVITGPGASHFFVGSDLNASGQGTPLLLTSSLGSGIYGNIIISAGQTLGNYSPYNFFSESGSIYLIANGTATGNVQVISYSALSTTIFSVTTPSYGYYAVALDSSGNLFSHFQDSTQTISPLSCYAPTTNPYYSMILSGQYGWTNSTADAATPGGASNDTGLARGAPAVVRFTNGSTGGGTFSAPALTPATLSSSVNNYNPGGLSNLIRVSASAPYNITGLVAGVDGQTHVIENVGSYAITFTNQDGSSSGANRFRTETGGSIVVGTNQAVTVQYDVTSASWCLRTTVLQSNVTLQGNIFNGVSELVQTNSASQVSAANLLFTTSVACLSLLGGL